MVDEVHMGERFTSEEGWKKCIEGRCCVVCDAFGRRFGVLHTLAGDSIFVAGRGDWTYTYSRNNEYISSFIIHHTHDLPIVGSSL